MGSVSLPRIVKTHLFMCDVVCLQLTFWQLQISFLFIRISTPINKEITLSPKRTYLSSFSFLAILIFGPDFLLGLITTDLVTCFFLGESQSQSYFVTLENNKWKIEPFDLEFRFEIFFEVLNFHCLIGVWIEQQMFA